MTLPPISCICLTYGRPHILEEAIHSFLQQDYQGEKELIIVNDFLDQTLIFDHPEVKLFNFHKRFRTVGEKMGVGVSLSSHKLIFVWDDDDIYLPHRLTFSVEKMKPQPTFFTPNQAWVLNKQQLSGPHHNLFHAGSCWSRQHYQHVGGYKAMNNGYDAEFERQLAQYDPTLLQPYPIKPADIYYIYRWGGTGSYHMSGFKNEYEKVAQFVQAALNKGQLAKGQITLQPHWGIDYVELVQDYLQQKVPPHKTDEQ